jgi:protein-S-isoprenylcysteine O-methyltransferase Ste14
MTQTSAPASTLPATRGRFKDLLFRLRGWGVIALGAGIVVWQWPLRPQFWLVMAGLPLVVLGVAMRVWARCYFTRGSDTRRIQAHRLVISGPYRRVRNPLYVGNIGVAVGLALAFAGPWAAGAFLLALLVLYSGVVRSEEAVLEQTWGESYREFRRNVPRWWLRFVPLPADPEAPPPAVRHALKKETERIAGALGAWAAALALAIFLP